MKKNILTIIIMAIVLINTVLTGLLIFTIVPTANKTNALVSKVASIVDLEKESPNSEDEVGIEDKENISLSKENEKMTINLKSSGGKDGFATVNVSLILNKKSKDYTKLKKAVEDNLVVFKEYVQDEFAKYTKDEVQSNKDKIKQDILVRIQEYMKSDLVIGVNFENLLIG